MRKIVFATNNEHKVKEVRAMLPESIEILSLSDLSHTEDIPETASTLEGNALLKARYVKEHYGYDCFADDTGLEVEALNGEPGVYSARYAGVAHDSFANMTKLLNNLSGNAQRKAHFRTVVALILDKKEYLFEGIVNGSIIDTMRGSEGFGYDPIFIPNGYTQTFAELGDDTKNKISHRAKAIQKLIDFLVNF